MNMTRFSSASGEWLRKFIALIKIQTPRLNKCPPTALVLRHESTTCEMHDFHHSLVSVFHQAKLF